MSYLKDHFLQGVSVANEIKELKEDMFNKFEESLKRGIFARKTKLINDNKEKIELEIDQSKFNC